MKFKVLILLNWTTGSDTDNYLLAAQPDYVLILLNWTTGSDVNRLSGHFKEVWVLILLNWTTGSDQSHIDEQKEGISLNPS